MNQSGFIVDGKNFLFCSFGVPIFGKSTAGDVLSKLKRDEHLPQSYRLCYGVLQILHGGKFRFLFAPCLPEIPRYSISYKAAILSKCDMTACDNTRNLFKHQDFSRKVSDQRFVGFFVFSFDEDLTLRHCEHVGSCTPRFSSAYFFSRILTVSSLQFIRLQSE